MIIKYLSTLFLMFILFSSNTSLAQNDANDWNSTLDSLFSKQQYKSIIEITDNLIQLTQKESSVISSDIAPLYFWKGRSYYKMGDFDKALKYAHQSLKIRREILDNDHPDISNVLYSIGIIHLTQYQYSKALEPLKEALLIREKAYKKQDVRTFKVHNLLAIIYMSQGEIPRAIDIFQQTLIVFQSNFGKNHKETTIPLGNLAVAYAKSDNHAAAYQMYLKMLDILQMSPEENKVRIAFTFNNLGSIETKRGNEDLALEWLHKAETLQISMNGKNTRNLIKIYFNQGYAYFYKKEFKKSIKAYQKSLVITKNIWGELHDKVAELKIAIAASLCEMGDFEQGLQWCTEALKSLEYDQNTVNPFEKVSSLPILSDVLYQKAVCLFEHGLKNNDDSKWATALSTILEADQLIKYRRTHYKESETKALLSQNASLFYELGLKTCYQLFQKTGDKKYIEQAFVFMENNKSQLLLAGLNNHGRQLPVAGVPEKLLEKEQKLKEDLVVLEEQLFEMDVDSVKTVLRNKIFTLQEEHFTLLEYFEKNHSNYYNLKYQTSVISLPLTQKMLSSEDEALVEYFINESYLYTLVIQKEKVDFFETRINDGLDYVNDRPLFYDTFDDFRRALSNSKSNFSEKNIELADLLIRPVLSLLAPAVNRLIIIPDGILGYLPFEVLYTENEDFLIQEFAISYAFSATLLNKQKAVKKSTNSKSLIAFAPDYVNSHSSDKDIAGLVRNGLYELPGAAAEVQQIVEITGGDAYRKKEALESIFKKKANEYRILHLSMHALINQEEPLFSKLLFSSSDSTDNGYLYANELYNMQLHADLAVLSACNTGFGNLKHGEGIFSLSRAFTYAGVPSTVMSLWTVPDNTTAEIMISFYEYLAEGITKDDALRQAKLSYLGSLSEPQQKHPYFWAGFVATGNMEAVKFSKDYPSWKIAGGILLLLLLTGGVYKKVAH